MAVENQYKCFTNYRHIVTAVWACGIIALTVGALMPLRNMPLWSIVLVCCIGAVSIAGAIVATALLRVRVDHYGITLRTSRRVKEYITWNDITEVQITSKYTPKLIIYDIRLKTADTTVKLKGDSYTVETIKKYGTFYDGSFKRIFLKSLQRADAE